MTLIKKLITLINKLTPKRDIILFNSYPAYSDNTLSLYIYIINHRKDITDKYHLIWGQSKKDIIPDFLITRGIETVDKKSLKGVWTFLHAKYVFSTHGYFPNIYSANGQVQVNLWHGCGYKAMTESDSYYRGDLTLATSEIYKTIQSRELNMDCDSVLVTGCPRNDGLFSQESILEKFGINKRQYQKIIIWMPTYRKARIGHYEVDGNVNSFGLSSLNKDTLLRLDKTLCKNNFLLIVKPHPMESVEIIESYGLTNIIVITSKILSEKGIELYKLLGETDCLLSDYSSVIIDYLLLDKPIAMVLSDMKEYKASRGFVFDPVDDYFPGPIISNIDELIQYIDNADNYDKQWENKRLSIKKQLHKYNDNHSSERVCNAIFGAAGKDV